MGAAILLWFKQISLEEAYGMVHESFYEFIQDVYAPWFNPLRIDVSQDFRASWDTQLEENKRRRLGCGSVRIWSY